MFDEVDSTNEVAKKYLANSAPEGLIIVSDAQSNGRGRLGRSWYSEGGVGLYLSLLLKPDIAPLHYPQLTLMAAVAVIDAINEFSNLPATLKWPNDILLKGKKLCGVLAEYCQNSNNNGAIIGIGINVNQPKFPEPLREIATSLRIENGKMVNRLELLRSVIGHLDKEYQAFLADGANPLTQKWTQRSDMFGKNVTLTQGTHIISGTALRLDENGNLILRTENGDEQSYSGGEVTCRPG